MHISNLRAYANRIKRATVTRSVAQEIILTMEIDHMSHDDRLQLYEYLRELRVPCMYLRLGMAQPNHFHIHAG